MGVAEPLGVFSLVIWLRVAGKEHILFGIAQAVNRGAGAYSTGVKAHDVIALKNFRAQDVLGATGVFDAAHTWPARVNHQRADAIVLAWVAIADYGDVELAQGCIAVINRSF
ncbi:MAG: hypothetical protein EBQ60_00200 [Actinobacteria bacterium]|nr:hypothetical protein [Actinomycetota bacterium]